jgi:hypothetical protein
MHGLRNATFQGNDLQLESDVKHKAQRSRQGMSSNTWTSSNGGGAEDGGYDDRTPFVQEYNRLAIKVRCREMSSAAVISADESRPSMEFSQSSLMSSLQSM